MLSGLRQRAECAALNCMWEHIQEESQKKAQRLDDLSNTHTDDLGEIMDTFKRAIAFVTSFDKGSRKPVTREIVFRYQSWNKKALNADSDEVTGRRAEAEAEAQDEDEDEESEEESEEEIDGGGAHGAQITDEAQVVELIKGIGICWVPWQLHCIQF